VPLSESISALR
jgi:transposase